MKTKMAIGKIAPSFEEVLNYLSNKKWNLTPDFRMKLKDLNKQDLDPEQRKQYNNYVKYFKEPLYFEHDLTTYKTGRIFAQYVLFPNKPIGNLYLKELIIPDKDYMFVSFDYSASQLRHLAVLNNAELFLRHFNEETEDIYQRIANYFRTERNTAKTIMLLLMFGGNENTIINKFPEISLKKAKGMVETHSKWFNLGEYNYNERKKLAHKIQKIESNFIKEKLIKLYEIIGHGEEFKIHSVIHDEIVLEVKKIDDMINLDSIIRILTEHPKVKMEIKTKIANTYQFGKGEVNEKDIFDTI